MLIDLDDLRLNAELSGPEDAPPVVFIHALGTNLAIWDAVLARLPPLRILRYDLRGHGASDVPAPPYSMGALIRDAERLMDHFALRDAVVLGLSIGGLVAQGLAVKRLDLVRGLVLSNTAARIGTEAIWESRIKAVREGGMAAVTEAILERWFGRQGAHLADVWRTRQLAQNPDGWIGCAAAIAGSDFYQTTARLTLPTLVMAGDHDGSTPADLVRETADLIRGSSFHLIRRSGHLPPVDAPQAFAAAVTAFLTRIGHR